MGLREIRLVDIVGYIANYGYSDGSGTYYITIDTGKCDGCGDCVPVCPAGVLGVEEDDYEDTVALVLDDKRRNIRYLCDSCKTAGDRYPLPCVAACTSGAIAHSW